MRHVMLAFGLLATSVVLGAWPTHAEPDQPSPAADDMSFLAALNAAGFGYSEAGKAISAGHMMCEYVDQDKRGKSLVAVLQKHNEDLTRERALEFMAIALQTYCPENLEKGMTEPPPKEEEREEEHEKETEEEEEPGVWPGVQGRVGGGSGVVA